MSDELGASVTTEFPDAVGLDKLLGGGGTGTGTTAPGTPTAPAAQPSPAPEPAAAAPEVPPVELPPDMVTNGLRVLDRALSLLLNCDVESPEAMAEVAATFDPLMKYYATAKPTVAALWASAIVGVAGYSMAKYQRVMLARRASPAPDVTPEPKAST